MSFCNSPASATMLSASQEQVSRRAPLVPKAVPIKLDFAAYRREKSSSVSQKSGPEEVAEAGLHAFEQEWGAQGPPGFAAPDVQGMMTSPHRQLQASPQAVAHQSWDGSWETDEWGQMPSMPYMPSMSSFAAASGACGSSDDSLYDENRYYGVIRDYNDSGGFGFLECPSARVRFGMDVWIHRRQMFGFNVGDKVSFMVCRNQSGQPQARQVIKSADVQRLKAKRQLQAERTELQLRQKRSSTQASAGPSRGVQQGQVMDEEEAKRFQATLKKRRN